MAKSKKIKPDISWLDLASSWQGGPVVGEVDAFSTYRAPLDGDRNVLDVVYDFSTNRAYTFVSFKYDIRNNPCRVIGDTLAQYEDDEL